MTPRELAVRIVAVFNSLTDSEKELRFKLRDGDATDWSKHVIHPADSYLEITSFGPVRVRDIRAVEINLYSELAIDKLRLKTAGFRESGDVYTFSLPLEFDTNSHSPDPNAVGPHTVVGTRTHPTRSPDPYITGIQYDEYGNFVFKTDVTDHGTPQHHPNPHRHPYDPGRREGDFGDPEPVPWLSS